MAAQGAERFDCVKMKHDAQAQLWAEYEARKSEFTSYVDFLNKTADEDPWIREFKERVRAAREEAAKYGGSAE